MSSAHSGPLQRRTWMAHKLSTTDLRSAVTTARVKLGHADGESDLPKLAHAYARSLRRCRRALQSVLKAKRANAVRER
jgi:hypothetical protein